MDGGLLPQAPALERRAQLHAALGDPIRLTIIDALAQSDRVSAELLALTGIEANLLSYHLDLLGRAGLIKHGGPLGDACGGAVALDDLALAALSSPRRLPVQPALFVCTDNAARSPLAAGLWRQLTGAPATSAGTHPAGRLHQHAVTAGHRLGLDLEGVTPVRLDGVGRRPALVITVCDGAHEELEPGPGWLHWSIPGPVLIGTPSAFDQVGRELARRIRALVPAPQEAAPLPEAAPSIGA